MVSIILSRGCRDQYLRWLREKSFGLMLCKCSNVGDGVWIIFARTLQDILHGLAVSLYVRRKRYHVLLLVYGQAYV